MSKSEYHKLYRQFVVYPFKENGIVRRIDNKSNEFVDRGNRTIKDIKGVKHFVSHIIYAVGYSTNNGYCISFRNMKNFTLRFKDGNKLNCNFDNIMCKPKKKFVKLLKHQQELSKYWI